mgnify:FL=1
MLGTFADVVTILSFGVSLLTFVSAHTILKNTKYQRTEYESERRDIQSSLIALRDNVLQDNMELSLKLRSKIRTELFSYRQKYLTISSLPCIYHLTRAIHLCNNEMPDMECREKLCTSLDFLIARFNKSEAQNNE